MLSRQRKHGRDHQHHSTINGMQPDATPIGKRPPSAMSKNVLQRDLQDRQRCEENAATARLPAKQIKYW